MPDQNQQILKSISSLVTFCAALLFACCRIEAKPAITDSQDACKTFSGWKLQQESYSAGHYDVRICKQAIRLQNLKTGIAIISAAPSWQTLYVDDESKTYCPADVDKLSHGINTAMALFGAPVFTDLPMIIESSKETGDMPEVLYGSPPGFAEKQKSAIRKKQVTANAAIGIHFRIWKNDYPRTERQIVARLYALPLVDGIPLEFRAENQNNHSHRELSTTSAVRSTFNPAMFTLPKNYRLVKSVDEMRPKDSQASIDLVLGQLANPKVETSKVRTKPPKP